MNVWVVGVSHAEGSRIEHICASKEIAERELFKVKEQLIKSWEEGHIECNEFIEEHCKKTSQPIWVDDMYKRMILALDGNDYEKWVNYPHDTPFIEEYQIIER